MEKLLGIILGALVGIIISIFIITVYGFAFMYLWNYVAHVYWAAAPQVTLLQAIATTFLLVMLRGNLVSTKVKK